jgi:hypothetical protein
MSSNIIILLFVQVFFYSGTFTPVTCVRIFFLLLNIIDGNCQMLKVR